MLGVVLSGRLWTVMNDKSGPKVALTDRAGLLRIRIAHGYSHVKMIQGDEPLAGAEIVSISPFSSLAFANLPRWYSKRNYVSLNFTSLCSITSGDIMRHMANEAQGFACISTSQ